MGSVDTKKQTNIALNNKQVKELEKAFKIGILKQLRKKGLLTETQLNQLLTKYHHH